MSVTTIRFDFDSALENLGGDRDLLRQLAIIFIEDAPGLVQTAIEAAQRADWTGTCRRVHSIKGLSADFYAEPTRSSADAIESSMRSGERIHAPQDEAWFHREIERLRELTELTCASLSVNFEISLNTP